MAEAGNAQRLEGFTYLGQPLPSPAETYEACQSELEKTSFVLLQILSSGYNVALEITDKYKDVLRLLRPHRHREGGEWKYAEFKMTRDYHASALAAYMLVPEKTTSKCQQCTSIKSRGPCEHCIAFGSEVFRGACSNCKASGTPTACSFAKAIAKNMAKRESAAKRKAMKSGEEEIWFEQDDLKNHTTAELEVLRDTIDAEIAERKAARTPSKKTPSRRVRKS